MVINDLRQGCEKTKALIAYSTRYDATAKTAEEIAESLCQYGFDVRTVDLKKERIKDISEFDLIVIGGGLKMGRWTGESNAFLNSFQKDLNQKKVAIFVSSAMKSLYERKGKTENIQNLKKRYLEDRALKYNLHPIALGLFGGIIDKNKMGFVFRRTLAPPYQAI
jgi:menaquinone-dependent protoporphyrinogen IX oxidase